MAIQLVRRYSTCNFVSWRVNEIKFNELGSKRPGDFVSYGVTDKPFCNLWIIQQNQFNDLVNVDTI